jgi:hypothetical protein
VSALHVAELGSLRCRRRTPRSFSSRTSRTEQPHFQRFRSAAHHFAGSRAVRGHEHPLHSSAGRIVQKRAVAISLSFSPKPCSESGKIIRARNPSTTPRIISAELPSRVPAAERAICDEAMRVRHGSRCVSQRRGLTELPRLDRVLRHVVRWLSGSVFSISPTGSANGKHPAHSTARARTVKGKRLMGPGPGKRGGDKAPDPRHGGYA